MPILAGQRQDILPPPAGAESSPARLAVSRNTTSLEAINALIGNYPKVGALVGHMRMRVLAAAFADAHPAAGPVLLGYGAQFPAWLASQPIAAESGLMVSLAQIDRMVTESRLAADGAQFDLAALASMTAREWCASRLKVHPAARTGWFCDAAPGFWCGQVHDQLSEDSCPPRAAGILITRREGNVSAIVIGACEHRILHGLRLGETVGRASLAAAQLYPGENITNAFRKIIVSGALSPPIVSGARK